MPYFIVIIIGVVVSVVGALAFIIIIQSFLDWREEGDQNEKHDSKRD